MGIDRVTGNALRTGIHVAARACERLRFGQTLTVIRKVKHGRNLRITTVDYDRNLVSGLETDVVNLKRRELLIVRRILKIDNICRSAAGRQKDQANQK